MRKITGKIIQLNLVKSLKQKMIIRQQNNIRYLKTGQEFYMSQDLVKQNKMLKDYVAALEGENKSRNIEKDVLLRQIEMLTNENNDLRSQIGRQGQGSVKSNQVEALTKNNKDLEDRLKGLTNELNNVNRLKAEAESEKNRLTTELQNLNKRYQQAQLTSQTNQSSMSQLSKLRAQNQQLRKQSYSISEKQKQIVRLQGINKQLRQKINEAQAKKYLTNRENESKNQQSKNIEIQRVKQEVIRQFEIKKQNQINLLKKNYQNILIDKDRQIGDVQRRLGDAENKVYANQSNSNAEVVQLRNLRKDLESRIAMFERERAGTEQIISQLRGQISEKSNTLSRIQNEKKQLQGSRLMIVKKDEQIQKSQLIIQTLKDNTKRLQRQIQQFQQKLAEGSKNAQSSTLSNQRMQQQLQNMENKYLLQIEELNRRMKKQQEQFPQIVSEQRKLLQEKNRENEELKKIIAGLSQNNSSLLHKLKALQEDYETQQFQNARKETAKSQEEDLRYVVEGLKKQLKSVKTDFRRIQEENKRLEQLFGSRVSQNLSAHQKIAVSYNIDNINRSLQQRDKRATHYGNQTSHKQFYNPINAQRQQNDVRYSKLESHKSDKHQIFNKLQSSPKPMNKDKWEALQRRITQLRQQNAELKQSLYS